MEGFSISRAVENKSIGGFSQYVVKLPGGLSYEPVTFNRFDFSSVAFFKWLTNGINQGGIQTADFSIRVGTESDYIRFVLKEAFPISWKLAEIIPQAENDPLIRMESLTIVYKTLELQHLDPDEK